MFARIANILGWLGVALVLAALVTWLVRPDQVPVRQYLSIAGLVCIVVYAASQWRDMVTAMGRRQTRYGALSIVSIGVVAVLLVGVNYLAEKYHKRWDVSAGREFTLSDQTRQFVSSLKEPLHIRVFDVPEGMQPFRDRLSEYAGLSNQVKIDYLDIDKERALADQYEARARGTIVVEYQRRVERVTSTADEQEITNAIIKAVQGKQRKLYFTTGHGEKDPGSSDPRLGYSRAQEALQRDNNTIGTLSLEQQADVPADADVVVVAGPTRDFTTGDVDALRRYLNKGGKALILIDPPETTSAAPLTNLIALVGEFGMEVGNNVVVDIAGQARGRGPASPLISNYPNHPITQHFRFYTLFPLARTVTPATGGSRLAQPLLLSSEVSWAETDIKALPEGRGVALDPQDRRGPVELGSAIAIPAPDAPAPKPNDTQAPPRPETRLVVIGDSDFAANDTLGFQANRDFLGNVISWLAQQENLISIRPKAPDDRHITLDLNQYRMIALLVLALVPGAVIALGIYTWWRRRG
jgi:ABC-type uncharacterized transport system involved in gliding motility auxiliary subunit